jgi:hypothetical protein
MTFRTTAYLEGKPKEKNSMPEKAECNGREVRDSSASSVRMVRLVNYRTQVPV